jgi:hypothetical protein
MWVDAWLWWLIAVVASVVGGGGGQPAQIPRKIFRINPLRLSSNFS